MSDPIIEVLSSEETVYSGLRVTVTTNYIVVRSSYAKRQVIIPLATLAEMKVMKTGHPSLLVISTGLFILSAAACASKEGSGAGLPIALLGVGSLLGYLATRMGMVAFIAGSEPTLTARGTLKQATDLVKVVESMRTDLANNSAPASRLASLIANSGRRPKPKVRLILRWRW